MELEQAEGKLKLALQELSHVLKEANMVDKGTREEEAILEGEEEEEDTQIQNSLPFYFEHVFGRSLGFSQTGKHVPRASASHGVCSDSQITSVMESQAFGDLGTGMVPCTETSSCCHILFQHLASPPLTTLGCGSQLSVPLFPSPGNRGSDHGSIRPATSEPGSTLEELPSLSTEDDQEPLPCPARQDTAPGQVKKRKRRSSKASSPEDGYFCPPSCTTIAQCTDSDRTVNLIALVIQVNSAMDVACRRGTMAGQTVQMSSLLLSDPTKSYFKLSLWREAALWAERLAIGDIVYFKNVRLKVWKGEFVGTTTMHSSVLNIHQPTKKLPAKVQKFIPESSVTGFMRWGRKHCGYLFGPQSIPKSQREVKFRTSGDLMGEPVVHCRAKLLQLISPRVALFVDHPVLDIHLHLLGEAASLWSSQLSAGVGQVWELMYVTVLGEGSQTQNSIFTLQTTSRTRLRVLEPTCDAASEVLLRLPSDRSSSGGPVVPDLSIVDVISNECSGTFKLNARANSMEFILPDTSRLSVQATVALSLSEMVSSLCRAVYVGCESCHQPLLQDDNGVYCQCMPCIMKSPGGYPASSYFFRPMLVVLADGSLASVTLTASQVVVPKILGWTARDVVQASLSGKGSEVGQVQRLRELFDIASHWLVNCLVAKDENSFLQELSFSIVDVTIA